MKIIVLMVNYDDEAQKLYIPLLAAHGITTHAVPTMPDALVVLVEGEYSCVVINGDYFDYMPLLKVMRKLITVPICVSVSRHNDDENHAAIKAGADIFRVRCDAAKNRVERFSAFVKIHVEFIAGKEQPITVITHDELQVFPNTRKAYANNIDARLLPKEFDILYHLITNKGIKLSYMQIYRRVWGDEYAENPKTLLWTHISRLRRKLKTDPGLPEFIVTERNYGYSFDPKEKNG